MGQMFGEIKILPRAFLLAGGFALIKPGIYTDLFGMAVLGVISVLQYLRSRKALNQIGR
jgi:UPF0716 family protein affecting phage T7 exclusion